MRFWILTLVVSWILDLLAAVRWSDHEKDLEILILRHQIGVLGRDVKRPSVARLEKLTLALQANRLKDRANLSRRQLRQSVLIFTPETFLGWHRTLVRRKWTQKQSRRRGRPRKDAEVEAVVVRLAQENPTWGYRKIEGELLKLGVKIGKTTVGEILRRHGIPPAPQRGRSTWRTFLNHYLSTFSTSCRGLADKTSRHRGKYINNRTFRTS